jgi:cobalt-zinc-cadmium efflux system protein
VLADLLGSIGVVVAGVIVLTTGWELADPLVALAIGALILVSAWRLVAESTSILLEATPSGMSAEGVARTIVSVPGVVEVHDLHVWTITSGFPALAAHVLVEPGADCHALRRHIEVVLRERFELDHTTLQVDHAHPSWPSSVELRRGVGRLT